MASVVRNLTVYLCLIAFTALQVKAQTDRTADFQAFCDKYQTQLNECEQFIETTSQLTAEEQALVNLAESNQLCLVEEGEQDVADACDILETICARVVTCTASARFRRSASASASASMSAESSETSD